jgi:peptide/nickel transport system permease protein
MTIHTIASRPLFNINFRGLARFARQQPLGLASGVFIALLLLAGIFASAIAPYDPYTNDYGAVLQAPSPAHWMGTDSFGRDIWSRILHGAQPALVMGVCASLLGATTGGFVGLASAYFGGRTDTVIQRVIDILLSVPVIVLALVVAAVLGRREMLGIDANLVFAIAIPYVPKVARVIRSAALVVRTMPYIDAARAAGYSHLRILLAHMAPNLAAPWLVLVTAFTAQTILLEASLSYLGVGVVEPAPAWGLMLSGMAVQTFAEAPWIVLFPGLAISLAVFAFSLLGDAMRDVLDPKFRR